MKHQEAAVLAGSTVKLKELDQLGELASRTVSVVDWFDRVSGQSWMKQADNDIVHAYVHRIKDSGRVIPVDEDVLFCTPPKVGAAGFLVHVSEVEGQPDHVPTPEIEIKKEDLVDRGRVANVRAYGEFLWNEVRMVYEQRDIPSDLGPIGKAMRDTTRRITNMLMENSGDINPKELSSYIMLSDIMRQVMRPSNTIASMFQHTIDLIQENMLKVAGLVHACDMAESVKERADLNGTLIQRAVDLAYAIETLRLARQDKEASQWDHPQDLGANIVLLKMRDKFDGEVTTNVIDFVNRALTHSLSAAATS